MPNNYRLLNYIENKKIESILYTQNPINKMEELYKKDYLDIEFFERLKRILNDKKEKLILTTDILDNLFTVFREFEFSSIKDIEINRLYREILITLEEGYDQNETDFYFKEYIIRTSNLLPINKKNKINNQTKYLIEEDYNVLNDLFITKEHKFIGQSKLNSTIVTLLNEIPLNSIELNIIKEELKLSIEYLKKDFINKESLKKTKNLLLKVE
ncbi:MAG: hypothetical protein RSD09_05130 [Bacilli bacterium]